MCKKEIEMQVERCNIYLDSSETNKGVFKIKRNFRRQSRKRMWDL